MSKEEKVGDWQRMSKEKKVKKKDKIINFFIEITYTVIALKYIIFYKIYFVMSNISIKTYSANIKYTIFGH